MEIKLATLADFANVTNENKMNLLGAFSTISFATVPAQYPQMTLATVLRATAEEQGAKYAIRVVAADQDGKPLLIPTDVPVSIPDVISAAGYDLSLIVGFLNVTFPKYGLYSFDLFVDGHLKHRVSLRVVPGVNPLTTPLDPSSLLPPQ